MTRRRPAVEHDSTAVGGTTPHNDTMTTTTFDFVGRLEVAVIEHVCARVSLPRIPDCLRCRRIVQVRPPGSFGGPQGPCEVIDVCDDGSIEVEASRDGYRRDGWFVTQSWVVRTLGALRPHRPA